MANISFYMNIQVFLLTHLLTHLLTQILCSGLHYIYIFTTIPDTYRHEKSTCDFSTSA